MKTRVVTETVQAESYQVDRTFYDCDQPGCSFSTEDQEGAERHQGLVHASKEKREVAGLEFHWFDSEADLQAYAKANEDHIYGDWSGAGWYAVIGDYEPCGKGCCRRYVYRTVFIDEVLNDYCRDRDVLQNKIDDLGALALYTRVVPTKE